MADNALAVLSSATALDGSELYYVVQGGSDRKTTGTTIVTLVQAQNLGSFATTTSAQLLAKITGPTGTGSLVFNNTPTLIAPVLGAATGTSLSLTGTMSTGANAGTGGQIVFSGSSTGSARVFVSSTAGNVTFRLPITNGGTNSVLVSDGSGNLSYAAGTGGGDMVAANNLSDVSSTITALNNLSGVRTSGGQQLTGGFTTTVSTNGTKSSGTFTFDPTGGTVQYAINNGAHSLAPCSTFGAWILDYINSTSAGAINSVAWTKTDGDAFDTVSNHAFRCMISVGSIGSYLSVKRIV